MGAAKSTYRDLERECVSPERGHVPDFRTPADMGPTSFLTRRLNGDNFIIQDIGARCNDSNIRG